ncbi:hypothetical protein L3Y34_012618 [Caenorhabditis briggsae]|uniref:Uncharacterized protein n=2 Tax=Caenorhabditis briggsae TaxID=6238 RepID=A0AAE9CVP0_CAEBR|nr:hypothetical protein L3Y34_012618 [Caenorhabditis briggsae]
MDQNAVQEFQDAIEQAATDTVKGNKLGDMKSIIKIMEKVAINEKKEVSKDGKEVCKNKGEDFDDDNDEYEDVTEEFKDATEHFHDAKETFEGTEAKPGLGVEDGADDLENYLAEDEMEEEDDLLRDSETESNEYIGFPRIPMNNLPPDYVPDDGGVITEPEDEESDYEEHTPEKAALVLWRIGFRNHNRVMSDSIYVDEIPTPPKSRPVTSLSSFRRGEQGEIIADFFQFRHDLNEESYKNKYTILLDNYRRKYREREDSASIRSENESRVHMGTNSEVVFQGRNMAMEHLRELLGQKLRLWDSEFTSYRSAQVGEMDLSKCVHTVTSHSLRVTMDSYHNIVEILNLHRPVLVTLTLECCEEYPGIFEMEQVRKCPMVRLKGPCGLTDETLLDIANVQLEANVERVTNQGLNTFFQMKLAGDIPDKLYIKLLNGNWNPQEALKDLEYVEYESEKSFREKNGYLPPTMRNLFLASLPTKNPDVRLAVGISNSAMICCKEGYKH